jgi:hypothetical protein
MGRTPDWKNGGGQAWNVVASSTLSFLQMEPWWQFPAALRCWNHDHQVPIEFIWIDPWWQPEYCQKGGEAVGYQGRKNAKTSNLLPLIDKNGSIIATTEIIAGHHNDSYELKRTLRKLFSDMKRCGLDYKHAYFNADSSFDTKDARKVLWNHGVIPNIAENRRNRKTVKRGRRRHFNHAVSKNRCVVERTFAWIDTFKRLLIRFERKACYDMGFHYIAFTLINLRNVVPKV